MDGACSFACVMKAFPCMCVSSYPEHVTREWVSVCECSRVTRNARVSETNFVSSVVSVKEHCAPPNSPRRGMRGMLETMMPAFH